MAQRVVLILALALVLGVLGTGQALAVSATADAHAHSRIGSGMEQQVTWHSYQWDLLGATADAQATVAGVHAHGHGRAAVSWFHISKGNYTHVIYSDTATPKHGWATANSSTGLFIIDGPPGMVEMRARLLGTSSPIEEEMMPDPHPELEGVPPQGMYADSFFDIFTEVSVRMGGGGGGGGVVTMMSGSLRLGGVNSASPGLSGNLTGYGETNGYGYLNGHTVAGPLGPRNVMEITQDFVTAPVGLPTGSMISSFFDIYTEISTDSGNETATGVKTAGSLLQVQLELVNPSGLYAIRALAPPRLTYDVVSGGLSMDTQGMILNGFILHSPRGDFTGGAILPSGFVFNDNTSTLIASQFGNTLAGGHDFGSAAAEKKRLWNAAEGRWDLDNWEYTFTLEGQSGVYTGQIDVLTHLPGDVDMDNDCDAWDIQQILARNSFNHGAGWSWADGDFNGDGFVDWQDIQMILDHGRYGQGLEGPLSAMVPEPATLGLLAFGGLGVLARRRRK